MKYLSQTGLSYLWSLIKKKFSNPNLLINGDFQVWQRGTSGSGNNSNSPFYVCDRWQAYSSTNATYTANSKNSDGSMNVAVDGSGTCTFKQILENALPSGDYTISFEVISLTGTIKLYYIDNGSNKHALNVVQGVNKVTISTTALKEISFYLYGTSTLRLKWVKLEKGVIATQFVPRIYDEEFLMCQRYYQLLFKDTITFFRPALIANGSTFLDVVLPCKMRVTPSIKSFSCNAVSLNNASYVATGSVSANTDETIRVGASASVDCLYQVKNVELDAEIY